jgi:hypothetical protein
MHPKVGLIEKNKGGGNEEIQWIIMKYITSV